MAFPLTTEAALCSCFRILLQDLAPILRFKELLSFWKIGPELKIFQRKISKVQDLLNNAEERRSQEIGVSDWMDDLRELSYEMENLVDEMNRKRVWMDQHVANLNQGRTSHGAADQYCYEDINEPQMKTTEDYAPPLVKTIKEGIDDASKRLEQFLVDARGLELKPHTAGRSPVSSMANRVEHDVGASVGKSGVFGRQEDQDFVIQELLSSSHSSEKNYSTVSIVGMGGVGKTTLAGLIFNDERVKKNFDVQSWACVSDAFDTKKVVKDLIEYVTSKNVSDMAAATLGRHLKDMVKGKKILIVLDDVWEVKTWDSLKELFTDCAQGSKILVTTRNKNVGNFIHKLEPLEDEDCWHLFKRIAFGEDVDGNLEKIGREIVKKCRRVPLAVKVIGSTLRRASPERWENALRNELWKVEPTARDEIFPALKLSYHYLPSPLKRCFGYLSLFPTDYELDQYTVVRLWIAEGFIEFGEGRSWEDIGHEYYKELQRRCLIQENNMMHDLIHSLACSVSGKFSYRMPNGTNSCMESVRHLSVIDGNMDLEAFDESQHLRTLFLFSDNFSELICDQNLLRVLSVEGLTLQELPISVGRLKCLRYLDLSWCDDLEYLPDSICELRNLQTLNLQGCSGLRSLPNDIGDLQKLRYLCLDWTSLSDLPTSIGNLHNLRNLEICSCERLAQLPEDIGNLASLRELHLVGASISSLPDSICSLKKLRVLNLDGCESLSNLPDEIGALQDLMELNLCGTSISHLPTSIGNLHNLRNLNIGDCRTLTQLPEDVGNLVSLRELLLCGTPISSLPDSICRLKKLQVLRLDRCNSFSNLPDEIGALQDLMDLNLWGTSISHLPKSIGNLHNLKNLNIYGCERLAQLPEDICNLSCLENFKLNHNFITRLPRGIGKLRNIERLNEFVVEKEEGWGIEELNGMNKLKGSLTISHLENVDSVEKARMASLKSKIYINQLYFEWSRMVDASDESEDDASDESEDDASEDSDLGGEIEASVLEALEPYPTGLVALSLVNYYGERVPMWMANLRFPSLEKLTLDGLQCVERVMDVDLPSLKYLKIENCPKLRVISMGLPNLEDLHVSSCQELTTLCMIPSLQGFSYASEIRSLQEIYIINCPELVPFLDKGLPPMLRKLKIESSTTLPHLPRALGHNSSPAKLEFSLRTDPQLKIAFWKNRTGHPHLKIAFWKNLPRLLRGLRHSTSLTGLTIKDCPELVSFPEEGLPPMLQYMEIASCTNLRHLPSGLGQNTSLLSLKIEDCPELVSFPEEGLPPRLQKLVIASCTNLRHLPSGLGQNTLLTWLTIKDCPELVSFPEEGLPPRLQVMEMASCTNLRHLLRGLGHNTSLTSLRIENCPELVSFPEEGLPRMLRYLYIKNCANLRHLPTGLRDLTSLEILKLDGCPVLGIKSDDQLPPKLRPNIANCSKLEQQLRDHDRKDWLTKSSFRKLTL